jgi:sulfate adenylyltransferase
MLAIGGYSPLKGFMDREAYFSVLRTMRLPDGLVWSIPIVLPVPEEQVQEVKRSEAIAILGKSEGDEEPQVYAVVQVSDVFRRDKEEEAQRVSERLT